MYDYKLPLFWLSFANNSLPKGERFLGVCIVEGTDILTAIQNAWGARCNPGGQVIGFGPYSREMFPLHLWYRVLNKRELIEEDLLGTWEEYGLTSDTDGYLHNDNGADDG